MLKAKLAHINIKDVDEIRKDENRTSWEIISGRTVGSRNISVGLNETYPGRMVPEHKHDNEEEVMYFISGQGRFVTKDKEFDLIPGTVVYNPPGDPHKIINTGKEVLRFIWMYSPQLQRQRNK
jgi:putative monooxygenase